MVDAAVFSRLCVAKHFRKSILCVHVACALLYSYRQRATPIYLRPRRDLSHFVLETEKNVPRALSRRHSSAKISLFSQHTKIPFASHICHPMTPRNNDNKKVADDTGGGFTFGSTAASSSAPAFTFNGGSGGANTPNPFAPSFHLWDHLLDNEDVFARVLAFLNPTERKFCTWVSNRTRRTMMETLGMREVYIQRHRTIAQKENLEEEERVLLESDPKLAERKTSSPLLKLLYDTTTIPDKFTIKECRGIQQLEMALKFCVLEPPREMKGFIASGSMTEEYFVYNVAITNEFELLRWAIEEKKLKWNQQIIVNEVAEQGNLQMLEYCVKKQKLEDYDCALHHAAEGGNLDCVRFFLEHVGGFKKPKFKGQMWRSTRGEFIIAAAARKSHLHVVKYLLSKGSWVTSDTLVFTARDGSLECLRYLRENDIRKVRWNYSCVIAAAARGDLEMCKYCVQNGCPLDVPEGEDNPNAMRPAVDYGHLEIVRFLHEEGGLEFDVMHILSTLVTGNVEILKYVWYRQIMPLGEDFLMNIWDSWVEFHGTLEDELTLKLNAKRESLGHLPCVKFLHEQIQIPLNLSPLTLGVFWGNCALIEYVLEKSEEPTSEFTFKGKKFLCETAAKCNYLDCLHFLHETAKFPMDIDTIRGALENFQPECARYAFERGAWKFRNFLKGKKNDAYIESDVRERIKKLESFVRGRTPAEIAEARSAYINDNYHGPGRDEFYATFQFLRL